MTPVKLAAGATPPRVKAKKAKPAKKSAKELVIVTGISGAGKASALKAFEDLGFHCVDNLPLELQRQIIDAMESQVLKGFQRRGFTRA